MADKDIGEQDVLKHCFLSASILICIFHTLRRGVICDKMGISDNGMCAWNYFRRSAIVIEGLIVVIFIPRFRAAPQNKWLATIMKLAPNYK